MTISAWGGGHCAVQVNPAASSGTTTITVHDPNENAWEVCWWNSTTDVSGKQYWNDPYVSFPPIGILNSNNSISGVGDYMIECRRTAAQVQMQLATTVKDVSKPGSVIRWLPSIELVMLFSFTHMKHYIKEMIIQVIRQDSAKAGM
jgi:hypothetical protein